MPDRRIFEHLARHALARADRQGERVAVLVVTLDRLARVSTTLGYDVGEAVVDAAAARMAETVRGSDVVARLGGNALVVLVDGAESRTGLATLAGKITRAVTRPVRVAGQEVAVGVSLGVAVHPEDGADVARLVRHAGAAGQRARAQGGGWRFWSAELAQEGLQRFLRESHLRRAIAEEALDVHYQPQLDLRTGRVVGVEALLRWTDPELGEVSPAEVIPVAEQTGLIVPLGEWVLRAACTQWRRWHDAGLPDLQLAVNLSALQVRQPGLVATVARVVEETGVDPGLLQLEVTESVVLGTDETTVATLTGLKALGMGLVIDDFGTGYASLAYLKRFPVDLLKLDQSFVRGMADDPADAAIARAVVDLAHALDLEVVAEGVETGTHLGMLARQGCDYAQGFLVSRAIPGDAIPACGFPLGRGPRAVA